MLKELSSVQQLFCFSNIWNDLFEMNKFVNKFLLAGDKFLPKLHLQKPGFTYNACGPCTKHWEGFKNLEKQAN